MSILKDWRFLDSAKITTIVQGLADQLDRDQQLVFLNRTAVVDADDDEITGKWKGNVFAADVIADDQAAVVYESGSMQFVTNTIPNLKIGQSIGQTMLNRIMRMSRNLASTFDSRFFTDWENTVSESLVTGIRERINFLICSMQMDATTYNRMGIDLRGNGWGMPADLKVTTGVDWSDSVNSTPITDLQSVLVDTAPDIYGETYNRVTMSGKAFKYLVNSAEFQNKIKGELRYAFGTGQINTKDTVQMRSLLANILNVEIEIVETTFWERANNGAKTRSKVLPTNKVILSRSEDDNNRNAMDFANGIVTESVVGTMLGEEGFDGESFGPIAYYTSKNDMNPPGITAWGVQRGFPRKHRETCTAVLTVGSGSNWNS